MMTRPICPILLLVLLTVCPAWASADTNPAADEKAVLKIEHDACEAYLHADADYLEKLLTDDFVFTNGRAEVNDKAAELNEVRGKELHYTTFENHEMKLRLHGDTAVVTGRTVVKGTDNGGKSFDVEVKFTDVFTRINGDWRMIAGHVSRIPAKQS